MVGLWPCALTRWRVRDRADDEIRVWRRVGCLLLEILTSVDRSGDDDLGGRVPDWR